MKKQPIFVAVDTNNIKRATQIVNATNKYIYGVKFGLEFFCSKGGREAVKKFKKQKR
jgi:orotidine-5'-phosphate decarboxylase